MKRLLLLAALAALFMVPDALASSPPLVYVDNQSTLILPQQVTDALPAFQTSVTRDLAPAWGTDALLSADPADKAQANMTIHLVDDPTISGALGYHDLEAGRPVAWIFARTAAQYQQDWRLTFSHELDEMLVDPWINRYGWWNRKQWLVEVCDPPESGQYAYFIGGVPLSDFITPKWYNSALRGRYDFTGHIHRPGVILNKGYASWRNPDGTWGQSFVGFSRFMFGDTMA